MNRFLSDPPLCTHPDNPLLADLIYGWGNEAWSTREEYLAACISHALKAEGSILECGSGLTSLLIAAIAQKQGQDYWVLEHQLKWGNKFQEYLNEYKLNSKIVTNPLKDYGKFCWYTVPLLSMPDDIALIVCDGPPRRTKGGRYGLAPIMKEKLKPDCTILLDDAYRRDELQIAIRWAEELDASFITAGLAKPFIIMNLN